MIFRRITIIVVLFAGSVWSQSTTFDRGVKLYNQGEYWQALVQFTALSNQTPEQNPQLTASLVMRMKCYAKLESFQRTILLAREFQLNYPNSRYETDVYFLLGEVYALLGEYTEAAWNYAQARVHAKDRNNIRYESERRTRELVLNRIPLQDLDLLYTRDVGLVGQFLGLLAVERFQRDGKHVEAADLMFDLRPYLKTGWLIDEALEVDWQLTHTSHRTVIIGVVLPLTGALGSIGNQILSGLRYAAMVYTDSSRVKVELDIHDNEADLGKSINIARKFKSNPQLIAVVGPLISENVKALAAVLNGSDKIILTPTATENELIDFSPDLYQYQPSRGIRGASLAAYAMNTLGLKTFAVLAPTDAYGRELTDSFTKKVDELDGQVLYEGWYAGDPTDLSAHFKTLRTIGFQRLLQEVATDTDSVRQANYRYILKPITPDSGKFVHRYSTSDSLKVKISTIDGLYMPIHQGQVYVASQIAFYNLNTYVLGDENWDDPDNLNKNRRYLPRLAFGSSNSVDSTRLEVTGMMTDYPMLYDRNPTRYDYLGFDTANLLLDGLEQSNFKPALIRQVFIKMDTWRGVIGQVRFGGNHPRQNQSVFIMEYDNQERRASRAGYYDQFGFHPEGQVLPTPVESDTTSAGEAIGD